MDIRIRKIRKKDAEAISLLSDQLGYDLSPLETANQIKQVSTNYDNCAFVALYNEKVVDWIYALNNEA